MNKYFCNIVNISFTTQASFPPHFPGQKAPDHLDPRVQEHLATEPLRSLSMTSPTSTLPAFSSSSTSPPPLKRRTRASPMPTGPWERSTRRPRSREGPRTREADGVEGSPKKSPTSCHCFRLRSETWAAHTWSETKTCKRLTIIWNWRPFSNRHYNNHME